MGVSPHHFNRLVPCTHQLNARYWLIDLLLLPHAWECIMPSATILFTDIVGFSLLATPDQARLISSLSGITHHEIRDLLHPPLAPPEAVALPTGDGMALAFLREVRATWKFERVMCLAVRLFEWAAQQKKQLKLKEPIRLRIGIHDGSIEYVTDINSNANICGDRINYTQRVMDAANENQLLISEDAYKEPCLSA